jgi:hypothetical protein
VSWLRKLLGGGKPAAATPPQKQFKLKKDQFERLVYGYGSCIASDQITVDGRSVGFMYREPSSRDIDSGWRFLSGFESEAYMGDTRNHAAYDINTIANYDREIIPLLDSPPGSAFERIDGRLVPAVGWRPRED